MRDQDVERVDVAVDQPFAMGVLQSLGDLPDQSHRSRWWHRASLGDQGRDRLTLDVLHHQEESALGFAEVVDAHQVFMLQLGADSCFALKSRDRSRATHPFGREDLQRHKPVEPCVPCQVDPPHSTLTEHIQEHITIDFIPNAASRQQLLRLPEG